MCTAPVMTRRGDGTWTVRNTLPCGVSAGPLLPLRSRCSSTSLSGSAATSACLTARCSPVASLVTTISARRAARSALMVRRMSSFIALVDLLHVDADGAAAGQPDLPSGLVGDAEFERGRLAAFDHVDSFGNHRAFDAATRHRAEEIALVVDHEVGADRPRRRAPGLDHGRKRDPAAFLAPVLGCFQDVFVTRQHETFSLILLSGSDGESHTIFR